VKAVILAGGLGTRLSEETAIKPKPMVEIGDKPILWHIMKTYSAYGINDFIICCGYKGHVIKQYFADYFLHRSDVTFDLKQNRMDVLQNGVEPWRVTLVDTGEKTLKGGRMLRVREYIGNETFCMTYGDGVSNVNIEELVRFHCEQGTHATLTAVQPPGRFGAFKLGRDENTISSFKEKPDGDGAWINGGFFVLNPSVFDFIDGDHIDWEKEPMERLAEAGQLSAYKHRGFWHPMDTLRDKQALEELWESGRAPWKVWP
jgi:glucose-1-phosphate cytidylyltransferase